MELFTPISGLTRVGRATATKLKRLGLFTVEDLLFYFPFRYEDFSAVKKIIDLVPNEAVTIKVRVELIANRRSFRKKKIFTEALMSDDSGTIKVVWFNQPYLTKNIHVGDQLFLSGKIDESIIQMVSPDYEKVKNETIYTAKLVPIYHLTEGVSQKQIRFLFSQLMSTIQEVVEYVPKEIIAKNKFISINKALHDIHFPDNLKSVAEARRRLKFDEMFLIQLAILRAKKLLNESSSAKISFLEKQTKEYVAGLPFQLTADQRKCSWEIIQDIGMGRVMNRLLEGDVGSGKTVVASLAILNVALNGYKTVVMAPTEILASQHYATFRDLFRKQKFNIILLTAGKQEINAEKQSKKMVLDALEKGDFDIVVGTHAVIQDKVKIKDLGLVIVDEQHRFGVKQRKELLQKDTKKELLPHFLSMTATPIPRSLVLSLYGDLKLSLIRQMPSGRQSIVTNVVTEQQRLGAYDFVRQQVRSGRQVFVICPLIDPSDTLGVKSVKQEYEKLSKEIFPDLKIGLMHGRLKTGEKAEVMEKFKNKELDILVSTSVIEVGIDIPNASVMMIEGADRFGLAQLHQFRGRVGRGEYQSYCLLFSDSMSMQTKKRLKFLETCTDGFSLAEKDLELRGPGEVYGLKQSGMPDLKIASLSDVEIIKIAQEEARVLLGQGNLSAELRNKLKLINVSMHFE